MACGIPYEVVEYFQNNMEREWEQFFGGVHHFAQAKERLEQEADNLHLVNVVVRTALGYVQETTATIAIYREAINKLFRGMPEKEVDLWLKDVGFHVEHNSLLSTLTKFITNLSQNIFQTVQTFIKTVANTIGLTEVTFHAAMSPSVDFKFS